MSPNDKPGDKPGDWMEVPQNLANGVHFFLCYAIVYTNWTFATGTKYETIWLGSIVAFLAVFVLVKEFWYDLKYETGETVATSIEDALGWFGGGGFAWLVAGVHFRILGH